MKYLCLFVLSLIYLAVLIEAATPSPTPTPAGATPTPAGATPTPAGATPTPAGATPTPNGATPTPGGSTPTPGGSTPTPGPGGATGTPTKAPATTPASTPPSSSPGTSSVAPSSISVPPSIPPSLPPTIPTTPVNPANPVVTNPNAKWSQSTPRVRLHVGVIPTVAEGPFLTYSLFVNGQPLVIGVPISALSGYLALGSDVTDTLYNVQIFRSDSPFPIVQENLRFTGGEDYTLSLSRDAFGRFALNSLADDNGNYGTARIRVVSNAQGLSAVPVDLGTLNGGIFTPLIVNIPPTGISPYVNIPTPGVPVQLAIRPSAGFIGNPAYFTPFFVYPASVFLAGGTYTFFIGGDSDEPPNGANSFHGILALDSFGENIPINPLADPNTARIRFGSASTNPTVQVTLTDGLGNVVASTVVGAGRFSNYFSVPAGFYTAEYSAGGALLDFESFFLTGAKDYSLVLANLPDGSSIILDMLDNNNLPKQGHAHVRFINAINSPFNPLIDIDLEHYPVVRRLKQFGVTPYLPIDISQPPKQIPVQIVESKGLIRSLFYLDDFETMVAAGNVYTFIITGFQAPGLVQLIPNFDSGFGLSPVQISSDAIDSQIQEIIFNNKGVSISAAIGDGALLPVPIIWAKGYGWSNLDNARRATRTTKYYAGAISSLMVSVAILRAMNESKINMNTDVSSVLNFRLRNPKQNDRAIRIHHLLQHTSTIVDNWDKIKDTVVYRQDPIISVCEFIENYLVEDGRYYSSNNWLSSSEGRVGNHFEFSHVGSAVLACVVEKLYNQPFHAYAADNIFRKTLPKRMRRSSFVVKELRTFRRSAKSYVFINANQSAALNLTGEGWAGLNRFMLPIYPVYNLLTTPSDIILFFHNIFLLNGGNLIAANQVSIITNATNIRVNNGTHMTSAGWLSTTNLISGRTLVGHNAWTRFGDDDVIVGFDALAYWDTSARTGVALFANTADTNGWLRNIFRILFDANNIQALRFAYPFPPACQTHLTEAACNANPDCTWIREGRPGSVCAKKVVEKAQPFAGQFGRAF